MNAPQRRRPPEPPQDQPPVDLSRVLPGMRSAAADDPLQDIADRPPASTDAAQEAAAAPAKKPAPRRRRAKLGEAALKLSAPSRQGETRRWVNDDGNRLAECRALGYEFVSETGIQTSDPGSRVSRLVGTKANGEPLHAYLMETPDELYAEGQAEKEAACRQIDEAITAGRDSTGRLENQYGHGSITTER